jgi:hypothetical protein
MADVIKRIHSRGPIIQSEAPAGESGIYPGMLIKLNSAGAVIKHANAGGVLGDENMIAIEDQLQGKTVDDVYAYVAANPAIVTYIIFPPGSEGNVLLDDGAAVVIGGKIISTGDGTVKATTGTPAKTLGVATKALDLSASANTANALVPCRFS